VSLQADQLMPTKNSFYYTFKFLTSRLDFEKSLSSTVMKNYKN